MDRKMANEKAKEILGKAICFEHRNVWLYHPISGEDDLIITKDNAHVKYAGVFRGNEDTGVIIDIVTGEKHSYDDVFGVSFYEDDPTLMDDHFTSADETDEDRIQTLLEIAEKRMDQLKMSFACKVMLGDLSDNEDGNAIMRLVILCNYLERSRETISLQDFAYLHHELM